MLNGNNYLLLFFLKYYHFCGVCPLLAIKCSCPHANLLFSQFLEPFHYKRKNESAIYIAVNFKALNFMWLVKFVFAAICVNV